jgi:DNA-binding NtrC family response regulator
MNAPILIVDDELLQRQMLATLIRRKLDNDVAQAQNGREALDILERDKSHAIRLVILDLDMPVMDGMETLQIIRQRYPALTVIMLTGSQDMSDAVQAMKLGATDFLSKPYEGERLLVTVKNALKLGLLTKEVHRLKSEKDGRFLFSNLIGHDGALISSIGIGRKAAASDIPVLLTGETGVGKEVFARAIHGESLRSGKPFIAVNCGAIPLQLAESVLFGHEKGSFTGATEKTIGKFREADGGTIFLDEVGELPLEAQVKLLRTLQQKEVEPVGATRPVNVNVRVISATNRDLADEVRAGRFREDLYFRLNVLNIEVPPLRERRSDIALLARHFIDRFCAQNERPQADLSQDAMTLLIERSWPGNVRELENAINRALVLADGATLNVSDFNAALSKTAESPAQALTATSINGLHISLTDDTGQFKTMDVLETEIMARTLAHHDGNITRTAEALGMAKSTFYRKMPGG